MPSIKNVNVYGLEESIVASGYPMRIDAIKEWEMQKLTKILDLPSKRAVQLAKTPAWSGHDQFLTGIIAQFDLCFSNKAWVEAERYHFLDFVSSMSTMHRLTKMNFDEIFNEYVTTKTREEMKRLQDAYNENPSKENKLALLYNAPAGLELTARMTTNYRQLKTIYNQRKNHLLPDWKMFCEWVETLPHSYLITGKDPNETSVKTDETPLVEDKSDETKVE